MLTARVMSVAIAILVALTACSENRIISTDVKTIQGPKPAVNTTPMATALSCISTSKKIKEFRLGVNDIIDGTGAFDAEAQNSRVVSQRPDLMMITALSQGGAILVNRNSVGIAEWEVKNAIDKKLGDGKPVVAENKTVDYRPVRMGSFIGSTHYVTGAITELNWNISSDVAEAGAYSVSGGGRTYRIGIAIDIMVTNTLTTEIVMARSYKKQIVGYEINAGMFRFVTANAPFSMKALKSPGNLELFNANLGLKKNEPVQGALRWIIELAAYDILRSLSSDKDDCDSNIPPGVLTVKPANSSIIVQSAAQPAVLAGKEVARSAAPAKSTVTAKLAPQGSVPNPAVAATKAPTDTTPAPPPQSNPVAVDVTSGDYIVKLATAMSSWEASRLLAQFKAPGALPFATDRIKFDRLALADRKSFLVGIFSVNKRTADILCFRLQVAGKQCEVTSSATIAARNQQKVSSRQVRDDPATSYASTAPTRPGRFAAILALETSGTQALRLLPSLRMQFAKVRKDREIIISRSYASNRTANAVGFLNLSEQEAKITCFRVRTLGGDCEVVESKRKSAENTKRPGVNL